MSVDVSGEKLEGVNVLLFCDAQKKRLDAVLGHIIVKVCIVAVLAAAKKVRVDGSMQLDSTVHVARICSGVLRI